MNRRQFAALLLGLSILPAVVADEKPKATKEEAAKFNDALVAANKKLFAAGEAWGTKAGFLFGKPTDVEALKAESDKLTKTVHDVSAEMKALKVPNAKSAQDFYQLHQRFMEFQQRSLEKVIKPVLEIAADKSLTDDQKREKATALLQKEGAAESTLVAELQKAQATFTNEFGLGITAP